MSNYDKTGPRGMGPGTGRGFGPCGLDLGFRRKFRKGWGMGRYFGWNQPQTPKDQIEALDDYKKALKGELEDVEKEKKELSKKK
jgi:hypothetical protein